MFRILHLSDIHIGKTYKESDSIACRIASDIAYNGLGGIDCIAVTGDIFDGQVPVDKSEFVINKAVNFFWRVSLGSDPMKLRALQSG